MKTKVWSLVMHVTDEVGVSGEISSGAWSAIATYALLRRPR